MKKYFSLVIICQFCILFSQNHNLFVLDLKEGDLIFQESFSNNMDNAIKQVTSGIGNYNFTHVGIVYKDSLSDSFYVIEATHPRVQITPLAEYLVTKKNENYPPISVVGRLKAPYQKLIPRAIKEALKLVGKEYDDAFDLTNDQYYCSELIYKILYISNHNEEVFPLNEMTFKSTKTGKFIPYWINHFQKLGIPIPEGKLGINPGAMSKSNLINIIYYYKP
jgi:hypothetical protein